MSTATASPTTSAPPLRSVLIAVAVAGPLAIGALRGVLPYDTVDDTATIAAKVAANPGAQTAVLWFGYLALLTLPIGVALVGRAAVRHRPVLGGVAAVVAWVGFLSLFGGAALDSIALAAPAAGLPVDAVVALAAALEQIPAVGVPGMVFVIGHILGAVLLGIALWGAVPRWAALSLAVSQPLHLVFAVVVPNQLLDALAWGLTAVGFAAAAAATTRRDAG